MNALIEVHECNHLVTSQLKIDKQGSYIHQFARMNAVIDDNTKSQYALLQPMAEHTLNVIIRGKETKTSLATFLHGAYFSLVKSTFLTALKKNHFTIQPSLTVKLVHRHLIPTIATTLGHQKHDKHSLQSTKLPFSPNITEGKDRITKLKAEAPPNQDIKTTLEQDISRDGYPVSDAPNNKTNVVIYRMIELKPA